MSTFWPPENLRNASLDMTDPRPDVVGWDAAMVALREYVDGLPTHYDNSWHLFCGPVGVGKSHLAACIFNAVKATRCGWVERWIIASQMVEMLSPGDRRSVWRRRLVEANPLVIDDIGGEYRTEWGEAEIEYVISRRYDKQRMTILTSNLSPEKLGERYGERVIDRIREVATILTLVGPSYRGSGG